MELGVSQAALLSHPVHQGPQGPWGTHLPQETAESWSPRDFKVRDLVFSLLGPGLLIWKMGRKFLLLCDLLWNNSKAPSSQITENRLAVARGGGGGG